MKDLMLLDATAQADLVRRKEVSALELVESAIDRIERLNPRLNAVVTRMDSHLKMDALYNLISPAARRVLDALGGVLGLAVALYVIAQSVDMIRMLAATGQRSVIARVPMDLMYLAIPLGFGSGAVFTVLRIHARRRARRAAEAAAAPEVV